MIIKELKILGMTKGEIKVYSVILYTGSSSLNKIHEKTGMERRAIYDILNKLIEKGFVTYSIEKRKRTYQCSPITKIKEKINEKKEELINFENLIPKLDEIYKSKKPKINLEIFRGKEGIRTIFESMLDYKECFFIGGGFYVIELLPNYWPQYNKRRINKKIKWYSLSRFETRNMKKPEGKFLYLKYLPKEFSGSPSVIFIFGNKIVNVLWGEEWFGFMVESKEITENYKKYYKYLWDKVAIK